jgi:hypothetical protein
VAIFAMEQKHRDRLRHLWEAGSKSVQKLIKMTSLSLSTIYKNIKRLKGDDLKRTPGSVLKRILKGNDRHRVSQIAVKNSLFSSGQVAERAAVKGHRRPVAGQFGELSVTSAGLHDYMKWLIDALLALVEKVIVGKGHKKLIIKLQSSYLHLC